MAKHISITQSQNEINVQAQLIKKLYNLVCKHELTEEEYDNTTNLVGEITLASPTYKEYADKVKEAFPELTINSLYYMLFQDPATEAVMSAYLLSKGLGDGIGITYDDAKSNAISQLPTSLKQNTNIQYFNELPNFEKITILTNQQFLGCSNLKEVNLSNIDLIQNGSTFQGCTSLEKITLGRATSVPQGFAGNCKKLTTVENSSLLTTVSNTAFGQCTLLENIDLSNVQTVGNESFFGCSALGEVDLSNIVTVGNRGFSNCTNMKLKYASLPNLNSVGPEGFIKTKIASIDAPSCTIIDRSAFEQCGLLTSINIPNVQTIGSNAFYQDSQLSIDVNLPNLTNIGDSAFRSTGITKISSLGSIITIPGNCFRDTPLTVIENNSLDAVTSIGGCAFTDCRSLTSIGTLSNVTTIGEYAFNNDTALTSLSLPETVISIAHEAFNLCTSCVINDLNLPNLTSIDYNAFRGTKVKKITSLGNITAIPSSCFLDCKELTTIESTATANVTQYAGQCFYGNTSLTSINLSTGITSIGHRAFTDCASLVINDLNLPNVTTIGEQAFRQVQIKKISSLGTCSSWGKNSFEKCKQLQEVSNNALSYMVEMPEGLFGDCSSLTSIGDTPNLKKIGSYALRDTSIGYLNLSAIEEIGSDAISNIGGYIEFKLTDSGAIDLRNLKKTGAWPFHDKQITSNSNYIDLGDHLESLNAQPFCRFNANLIVRNITPPEFTRDWDNLKPADGYYIYVPAESLTTYQTKCSRYSSMFKTIENDLPAQYR